MVGGAINANIINNTEIESNFINNTADVSLELIDESIIDEVLWYFEELGLDPAIVEYIWELYETHPIDIGFGGAIAVVGILENSNITGEFVNNEGADAGGALCVIGTVNKMDISGSYEYNRAGLGGSLFLPVVKHSTITGGYMNNYAVQGGAIFADVLLLHQIMQSQVMVMMRSHCWHAVAQSVLMELQCFPALKVSSCPTMPLSVLQ